jgi:hypothetical protein
MAAYGKAWRKASAPLPNKFPLFSLLFTGNYQRRPIPPPQESSVLIKDEREKTAGRRSYIAKVSLIRKNVNRRWLPVE